MSIAITTTLSQTAYQFLDTYSRAHKKPKNSLIEEGLELLKAKKIEEEIAQGFSTRKEEYKKVASDFGGVQTLSLHE
jgi:hypothetical protein